MSYQHKRSCTPGLAPTPCELADGEIALNTHDAKAYIKKCDGTVVPLGGNATLPDVISGGSYSCTASSTNYACVQGECVQQAGGAYASLAACQENCGAPPPSGCGSIPPSAGSMNFPHYEGRQVVFRYSPTSESVSLLAPGRWAHFATTDVAGEYLVSISEGVTLLLPQVSTGQIRSRIVITVESSWNSEEPLWPIAGTYEVLSREAYGINGAGHAYRVRCVGPVFHDCEGTICRISPFALGNYCDPDQPGACSQA